MAAQRILGVVCMLVLISVSVYGDKDKKKKPPSEKIEWFDLINHSKKDQWVSNAEKEAKVEITKDNILKIDCLTEKSGSVAILMYSTFQESPLKTNFIFSAFVRFKKLPKDRRFVFSLRFGAKEKKASDKIGDYFYFAMLNKKVGLARYPDLKFGEKEVSLSDATLLTKWTEMKIVTQGNFIFAYLGGEKIFSLAISNHLPHGAIGLLCANCNIEVKDAKVGIMNSRGIARAFDKKTKIEFELLSLEIKKIKLWHHKERGMETVDKFLILKFALTNKRKKSFLYKPANSHGYVAAYAKDDAGNRYRYPNLGKDYKLSEDPYKGGDSRTIKSSESIEDVLPFDKPKSDCKEMTIRLNLDVLFPKAKMKRYIQIKIPTVLSFLKKDIEAKFVKKKPPIKLTQRKIIDILKFGLSSDKIRWDKKAYGAECAGVGIVDEVKYYGDEGNDYSVILIYCNSVTVDLVTWSCYLRLEGQGKELALKYGKGDRIKFEGLISHFFKTDVEESRGAMMLSTLVTKIVKK